MTDTAFDGEHIDPERLYDADSVDTERRTNPHEDGDHCEADAAGRAIVGVTDEDGQVLLAVHADGEHVVLPNETVAPDERWTEVGRERVEGIAGVEVELDAVERVRRVDHVIEGESTPHRTTHHVVFAASLASPGASVDGLCETNDWSLGWHDEIPVEDFEAEDVLDDIRLFLE